jgi:hypothetical protein
MTTNTWNVGTFYGLAFTRIPACPSTGLIGASPYYGPPGIFSWTNSNNTFALYKGDQPTFQPYYWQAKMSFTILPNIQYNPATDLSAFGGYSNIVNEYQDTELFLYANSTIGADYGDVSTINSSWQWGQEKNTNYAAWNDNDGYNLLSYIYNISVRPTIPEYAVHIRAYDPIPQFVTGLRIIGNNYTDFGTPTLGEISQEISSLHGYQVISDISGSEYLLNTQAYNAIISTNNSIRLNNGNRYSHAYADALTLFNNNLYVSSIAFGTTANYSGTPFTFAGYADVLQQYTSYYSTIINNYAVFTNILSTKMS